MPANSKECFLPSNSKECFLPANRKEPLLPTSSSKESLLHTHIHAYSHTCIFTYMHAYTKSAPEVDATPPRKPDTDLRKKYVPKTCPWIKLLFGHCHLILSILIRKTHSLCRNILLRIVIGPSSHYHGSIRRNASRHTDRHTYIRLLSYIHIHTQIHAHMHSVVCTQCK